MMMISSDYLALGLKILFYVYYEKPKEKCLSLKFIRYLFTLEERHW